MQNTIAPSFSSRQSFLNSQYKSQVTTALHSGLFHGLSDPDMKARLQGVQAVLWQDNQRGAKLSEASKQKLLLATLHGSPDDEGAMKGINKVNVQDFLINLAHMGQMDQMAALITRENVFAKQRQERQAASQPDGMAANYIANADGSVEDLVKKISSKVFEQSFTAHPTNMNDLEGMEAQRDVMQAIDGLRGAQPTSKENHQGINSADEVLRKEIKTYTQTTTTPREALSPEKDTNLTTADETANMLYFLKRAYENVGNVYLDFDHALAEKAEKRGETYDPKTLKLNYVFSSWGSSGDKDGNTKVNAYTLLQSLGQHMEVALGQYSSNLKTIDALPESLGKWRAPLEKAYGVVQGINQELRKKQNEWAKLTPEEADKLFKKYSDELYAVTHGGDDMHQYYGVDMHGFSKALDESILDKNTNDLPEYSQQQILNLKRRYDIFGDTMGRIEFRETANNFCKVINYLMDGEYGIPVEEMQKAGYTDAQMQEAEENKQKILTDLLQNPDKLHALVEAKRESFEKEGPGTGYANIEQLVNHTFKRLELASKFQDSFVNQVLAECQDASNVLEAQVLMKAVSTPEHKLVLGVQPLFEDPDVLVKVGGIMENLFQNDLYQQHLKDFALAHPKDAVDGKATQVVQFAHSDNARRGGTPASAAAIYMAHKAYREKCAQYGVVAREFQGGSMSDPFRSGVRSMVGMINDYDMYDFTKVTIQNGDLLNIYNYDPSAKRFMEGILVYQAQEKRHLKSYNPTLDDMALKVAFDCKDFYRENHFRKDKIGLLFPLLLSNADEVNAGNVGSRGQRVEADAAVANFKTTSVNGFADEQPYMDPEGVRTITYSELLQHHLICPTWLSVSHMKAGVEQYVNEHFDTLKSNAEVSSLLKILDVTEQSVDQQKQALINSPKIWKLMRDHSPAFKKIMDHAGFGLAMTNFKTLEETIAKKKAEFPAAAEYLEGLEREYIEAGQIVEMSFTGKVSTIPSIQSDATKEEVVVGTDKVQNTITGLDGLKHLRGEIETKRGFLGFMHQIQEKLVDVYDGAVNLPKSIARLLHAARDTVTHTRYLAADDLVYRQAVIKQINQSKGMAA